MTDAAPRAILFDLDDTLILEEQATLAAVDAAAALAQAECATDARTVAARAVREAEERWDASPVFPYCDAMGIWWGEALWGAFAGDGADLAAVRAFVPRFRESVWRAALAENGARLGLARDLKATYIAARRSRETVDPDAARVLRDLGRDHRLALITNGAGDVQREKLARSGLEGHFEVVLVSAELGIGKPEPRIFTRALELLGVDADRAVMVGDTLDRDVVGARGAARCRTGRKCRYSPIRSDRGRK